MTPRHAAPPDEREQALFAAAHLADLLATRHNIPADVHKLPRGAVVSVFAGLVAHVDHVIWWTVPDVTGTRDKPLKTYANGIETAADRIAVHYRELRSVPLADLLSAGRITALAAELLNETEVRRDAAPV
ncbi:hypothetical protein ACOZ38_25090 [Sphaerisporangium viridialbum]|uniref:hypothetical protein n=1 Tax=Sphaerisporangium viridialbum TaxID=46189 RepID=UPI003C78C93C